MADLSFLETQNQHLFAERVADYEDRSRTYTELEEPDIDSLSYANSLTGIIVDGHLREEIYVGVLALTHRRAFRAGAGNDDVDAYTERLRIDGYLQLLCDRQYLLYKTAAELLLGAALARDQVDQADDTYKFAHRVITERAHAAAICILRACALAGEVDPVLDEECKSLDARALEHYGRSNNPSNPLSRTRRSDGNRFEALTDRLQNSEITREYQPDHYRGMSAFRRFIATYKRGKRVRELARRGGHGQTLSILEEAYDIFMPSRPAGINDEEATFIKGFAAKYAGCLGGTSMRDARIAMDPRTLYIGLISGALQACSVVTELRAFDQATARIRKRESELLDSREDSTDNQD